MAVAFGDFVFDPVTRELRRQGSLVKVDPQQLDLLLCFLEHPGVLLSKQDLLERVWGGRAIADSALSVAVAKLRKVLRPVSGAPEYQDYIENRYGRGYRFLSRVSVLDTDALTLPAMASDAPSPAAGAPLVGRAETLQRLRTALTRAEGGVCALIGEPGIGKTRLAEGIERSAVQAGMRVAWGRCLPAEGTPPLWPIAQVLRTLNVDGVADAALRLLEADVQEAEARRDAPESDELTRGFVVGTLTAVHRAIAEVTQALARLCERTPLLIVLDDLQWADAATLRLLTYLLGDIARCQILLLLTVRSNDRALDTRSGRELLRLLSQHKCERIELERLGEADVAEYVTATFGESGNTELARAVYARSEGNPFFMVELLRPWHGTSLPAPAQLRLSGLALDLVRQRLSNLPDDARRVLSAAAVIGHDFDLGLLGHAAQRNPDELLEALDSSLANETVVASSHIPGAYAFGHELIREALYSDLTTTERCRLHLRAAEGLSRRRSAGVNVPSGELAKHYLAALPQGQVEVAIAHARTAAIAFMRMAAHADARALLQRALDALKFCVEPNPETLTALLLELAMAERILGDPAYVDHLKQGVGLARQHRFGSLLTVAGQLLSPSPGLLARAEAASVLSAANEVLPEVDTKRRAVVAAHLSWTPPNCLSARKVSELLRQADALAQASGDVDAYATVRDARLFFSAGPETLPVAQALADEIDGELERRPETARSTRAISTATFRLITSLQRGDQAALQQAIEARGRLLTRLNNSELNWHHQRMLLVMRMNRGEFNALDTELELLRQRAQRLRLQAWPALWARDYSELLRWTGDVKQLATQMRSALTLGHNESPTTLARKLRAQCELGLHDDMRAGLARVSIDALHDLPHDRDYLAVIFHLAWVSVAAGSIEHCQALYGLLTPHAQLYAADISFHCDGSLGHALGKLARALGQHEAAREHFEQACQRNALFGLKACALESQFELARVLLDAPLVDDRNRGRELLARAREQATALGLQSLVQSIDLSP